MVTGIDFGACYRFVSDCRNPDGGYRDERAGFPPGESDARPTRWAIVGMCLQGDLGQFDPKPTQGWAIQCFTRAGGASASPKNGDPAIESTWDCLSALHVYDRLDMINKQSVSDFLLGCRKENGGFHEEFAGDLVGTYQALCGLHLSGGLPRADKAAAANFIRSYQAESAFKGDDAGEPEVSYCFYGLASLRLLGQLDAGRDFEKKVKKFVLESQNPDDGGFGFGPGQPSTLYSSLYAAGALKMLDAVGKMKAKEYAGFIASCQTSAGGFGSRPGTYDESVTFSGMAHMGLAMLHNRLSIEEAAVLSVRHTSGVDNQAYASRPAVLPVDAKTASIMEKLKQFRK